MLVKIQLYLAEGNHVSPGTLGRPSANIKLAQTNNILLAISELCRHFSLILFEMRLSSVYVLIGK